MHHHFRTAFRCVVLIFAAPFIGNAEETYISIPLGDLNYSETANSSESKSSIAALRFGIRFAGIPYAALDSNEEAFIACENDGVGSLYGPACTGGKLVARLRSGGGGQSGVVVTAGELPLSVVRKRFTIPNAISSASSKADFLKGKQQYYSGLADRNIPGGAWFRSKLEEAGVNAKASSNAAWAGNRPRTGSIDDTFDFLSGGRAISENLQLDRGWLLNTPQNETIWIETLNGISVAEIDWTARIKGLAPQADVLAKSIPSDQYGLFISSFPNFTALLDESDKRTGALLPIFESRSEEALVRDRYQAQLCLPLGELGRLAGPLFVKSLAITSSDPYFRTGTDLAVLLETGSTAPLTAAITALQAAAKGLNPKVVADSGIIDGVAFSGVVTPDRSVSSYVAELPNAVVITNSKVQLQNILAVSKGKIPALSSLGEYTFFRNRYLLNSNLEAGFLIVPDGAIRKWGSAKWRIGASRRTRAANVLSFLNVKNAQKIVSPAASTSAITELEFKGLGDVTVGAEGTHSSRFGTAGFMTPISEMEIKKVSTEESQAYVRFRDTYSSYWRSYFDPIAATISLSPVSRNVDVSVLPLIAGSEYNSFRELSNGVTLDLVSGDIHKDALFSLTMALDSSGPTMGIANGWGAMFMPNVTNPISWVGKSVTLFLDDGPFWKELEASSDKDKFVESNYRNVPVGLFVEVKDSLKLTAFLGAVRGFIEQSSPGVSNWTTLDYKGTPYVKIQENKDSTSSIRPDQEPPWVLYYAAAKGALIISLREDLLQRAIDRLSPESRKEQATDREFIVGSTVAVDLSEKIVTLAQNTWGREFADFARVGCFDNIPILNELKRAFPDEDPNVVYTRIWKSKLFCSVGGTYAWNSDWKSMESTVLGHAGGLKVSEGPIAALEGIGSVRFALGFVDDGIRAKVSARTKGP